MNDGLFVIDGEEPAETPWEFDTVSEAADFDMGETLRGHIGVKTPEGDTLIARAKYRWPIWLRIDKAFFKDCESLEFRINSRGIVEVRKKITNLSRCSRRRPGEGP